MQIDVAQDAERDLVDIWSYTAETWGHEQADRYQNTLFECAERLLEGVAVLRSVPGAEAVEAMNCKEHVIFATRRSTGIVILAILHQRMDLARRLANRLG